MNKNDHETNYGTRRKIIGVMGGRKDYPDLTGPLGALIACMGYHLLTGAGDGIMEGVSKAFYNYKNRQGLVLGIVRAYRDWDPKLLEQYKPNKVNNWVEIPIYTHLRQSDTTTDSRNHINVLTSDVVIALPGGTGTASEVKLALQYGVPIIFFLGSHTIEGKLPGFYTTGHPDSRTQIATDIAQVEAAIKNYLPNTSSQAKC